MGGRQAHACHDSTSIQALMRLRSRDRNGDPVYRRAKRSNAFELRIGFDRSHSSLERYVALPVVGAEYRDRDTRVIADVSEWFASFVHVHQYPSAFP